MQDFGVPPSVSQKYLKHFDAHSEHLFFYAHSLKISVENKARLPAQQRVKNCVGGQGAM